jgi:hypothetical protein
LHKYNKKGIKLQEEYIQKILSKKWIKKLYSLAGAAILFTKKRTDH